MTEPSRKAFQNIQKAAKLIYGEIEAQIEPSAITLNATQLLHEMPEAEIIKALDYLVERDLISYTFDTRYSADYYKYNAQYEEAKNTLHSSEYFFNEDKMRNEVWSKINLYDNQRKAEARQWHSTIFAIQPKLGFEDGYKDILGRYDSIIKYKLELAGEDNNILCVNRKYRLHKFSAEWQLELMRRALKAPNGTRIDAPENAIKGMPQLMPDIIKNVLLRKLFFTEITKNSFVIRHTITDDFIKNEGYDTKEIDKELRKTHANAK